LNPFAALSPKAIFFGIITFHIKNWVMAYSYYVLLKVNK
jgi:hypothetical protein